MSNERYNYYIKDKIDDEKASGIACSIASTIDALLAAASITGLYFLSRADLKWWTLPVGILAGLGFEAFSFMALVRHDQARKHFKESKRLELKQN